MSVVCIFFGRSWFWYCQCVHHIPLQLVCSDSKNGKNMSPNKKKHGSAKILHQKHEPVCHLESVLVRVSQVCLPSDSWHWSVQLSADDFPNPMYERNLQVMDMRQNHIHNSDGLIFKPTHVLCPLSPQPPQFLLVAWCFLG